MQKDEFLLKRIRELANLSYQRDIVTFSDFLNLNEQNIVRSVDLRSLGVNPTFCGGYEHAERQVAAFYPAAPSYEPEYPIDCIRIRPRSPKFSEELTHRDYLGALLHLGVDRSVVGDILTEEKCAWFFCLHKMSDFFLENLDQVRHTQVFAEKVEDPGQFPTPHFQEIHGTCSSVRLDSLIALAFGTSRSSLVPSIEGGLVFVNGKLITSNGYTPREGDIISVRHKGRFLYDHADGNTKKGRMRVTLRRYIG